jgi:hypothetical protein
MGHSISLYITGASVRCCNFIILGTCSGILMFLFWYFSTVDSSKEICHTNVLFICKTKSRLRRRHCGLARHFNSEYFSQSTTSGAWKILFFGPNFFYSLLRPKKHQIRNNFFFCPTKFRARAPSNLIVVKYSKCSRAGF